MTFRSLQEINKESIQFNREINHFLKDIFSEAFKPLAIPVSDIAYLQIFSNTDYISMSSSQSLVEYFSGEIEDNGYFNKVLKNVPLRDGLSFVWSSEDEHPHINRYKEMDVCNGWVYYIRAGSVIKSIQYTTKSSVSFTEAHNCYEIYKEVLNKISPVLINRIEARFLHNNPPSALFTKPVDMHFNSARKFSCAEEIFLRTYIVNGVEILLTRKENEILKLLAQGYTAQCIASSMNIAKSTVNTHIDHMRKKTNSSSKMGLVFIYHNHHP